MPICSAPTQRVIFWNTTAIPISSPPSSGLAVWLLSCPMRWTSFREGRLRSHFSGGMRGIGSANKYMRQIPPRGNFSSYQKALVERFTDSPQRSDIQRVMIALNLAKRDESIDGLADQVNLSQKQFERLFARVIGMMPKRYFRLARFLRIVSFLTLSPHDKAVDWTSLALNFGYYDQSHMIKDFQAFAGIPPSRFSAATAGVVEVVHGDRTRFREV